jgi:cytochrome P450
MVLTIFSRESMRLYPPVPTNGARRVTKGSGGKIIAKRFPGLNLQTIIYLIMLGRFIPEQTEVFISAFCLHRNGDYFKNPDEFIPGRWLGEKSTINADAYIPFSRGPANCVGRNLARQEMLMLSSLLLQTFNFEIAEQEDFTREVWEAGLKDYFVLTRGKLRVFLKKRS